MKIESLSRRRLTLLGGLAAATLVALAMVSVAYGTGPFGTATTTTLADGTSVNTINAQVNVTVNATRVRRQEITEPPVRFARAPRAPPSRSPAETRSRRR